MKLLNALAHPIIIFVLCIPLIKIPDNVPQIVVWATFCSWALYFLLGANWKAGLWGGLCFVIGEICAIFIIVQFLATIPVLGGGPAGWALMIAVGLWAALMVLLAEQVKQIGAVPAYFIGAGLYFAVYFAWWPAQTFTVAGDYITPLIYLAVSMAFGFFMGWLTILLYGWWANFSKRFEAPAPVVAKAPTTN